jgi:hypothetical protein
MQINLTSQIANISLQIGDQAYFIPNDNISNDNGQTSSTDTPLLLGTISGIGSDYIVLDSTTYGPYYADLQQNDFIMFSKNKIVNNTSMLGYYAEVKLKNSSTAKAELFALSSEVAISSK